jgi:hypothetical protein
MKRFLLLSILNLTLNSVAQKADKLRVGEKIPFTKVIVLDEKKISPIWICLMVNQQLIDLF